MRNSQLIVGLFFAAALGFGLGNCGGGSGSSTGNPLACPTGSTGTCTQAELNQYSDCITTACSSAYSTCFGSGFASGSFSGPCASYAQCTSACGCSNTTCRNACAPSAACQTCITGNLLTCVLGANCQLPACAGGVSGAGGSTGGGTGGKAGGSGGSSGAMGGSTGTTGTCADLNTCCNSITNATIKAQCTTEYNLLMPMGDAACGAAVSGLRQAGICQ